MTNLPAELKLKPRTLALITGVGLIAGTLIVLGAILPAEYNVDPLGLGRLTGISRLWAPEEEKLDTAAGATQLDRYYDTPFRTDVIEIPLTDFMGGARGSELEYKVHMKEGATLIYSWEVQGTKNTKDLHYDFHGHTTPTDKAAMTVATYKQAFGLNAHGALTAPFEGIQGWQFSNSADGSVVVKLKLAGYYDLVPSGQPGNEAGIVANVPAAQARPDFKPPNR